MNSGEIDSFEKSKVGIFSSPVFIIPLEIDPKTIPVKP